MVAAAALVGSLSKSSHVEIKIKLKKLFNHAFTFFGSFSLTIL